MRRRRQRAPLQKTEQRKKEEESGWSLSLKGTGYPGDRAGQYNYNIKHFVLFIFLLVQNSLFHFCVLFFHFHCILGSLSFLSVFLS